MLNTLASDAILFVVDDQEGLIGSLTDGDIRRALIKGLGTDNVVDEIIQPDPKFIIKDEYSIGQIINFRKDDFKIIPVLDSSKRVLNIINFRTQRTYLPVDAIIMAGGRGARLKPLTDNTPKPLLKVGEKAIIDHNVDRLRFFGVDDFWVSVRYLGEQLEEHLGNGTDKGININYVWEDEPLGTIGAVKKIKNLKHDFVLVTNSDVLTTIDYEDFFLNFVKSGADMSVATIPYEVNVPYAVLETVSNDVIGFKEKPKYTYYSNAGIYVFKRDMFNHIPEETFFNATDLMSKAIRLGLRINSYPLREYWLDIGKHEDFKKAQEDILHLNLEK